MNEINKQILDIKIVLFDVDGVKTDGTIYISEQEEYLKAFHVKYGLAIELLRSHGFLTGIISGKASKALTLRCEQLTFNKIITGCKTKLSKLQEIYDEYSITLEQIAFCGDDVLDFPIFEHVGLSVAPADAHALVLNKADWIAHSIGGRGMVREFVDRLLCLQMNQSLEEIYQPLMSQIIVDDVGGIEQ